MANSNQPEITKEPANLKSNSTVLVKAYLRQHLEIYRQLAELQEKVCFSSLFPESPKTHTRNRG